MVTCRIHEEEFYKTGYALIQERPDVRERLDNWKLLDRSRNQNGDYVKEANTDSNTNSNSPSILMIGIDSVSRVNLMRSMPRTAKYLYENNWFEMAGYNKVIFLYLFFLSTILRCGYSQRYFLCTFHRSMTILFRI